MGACRVGEQRVLQLAAKYGMEKLTTWGEQLLDYSERLVRAELRNMPAGEYDADDWLDDDGVTDEPRRIAVRLKIDPEEGAIDVDFAGSSVQVAGAVNAVRAITLSACFYVLRCLLGDDAPATEGILRPLTLHTPEGSIVNARPPAAVAGGNVETSQRIVDVLMRALAKAVPERVPAASAGTMSNLAIGGIDRRAAEGGSAGVGASRGTGEAFAYYETAAGGMGARPGMDGISGVHTHMTNSLNTPVEALEYAYPFRVRRYAYRYGSGGDGRFRGGDGLIREVELLTDAEVTLLADRRKFRPYGLEGGGDGAAGRAVVLKAESGEEIELPGKCSRKFGKGDVLRIETPGGGGWGKDSDQLSVVRLFVRGEELCDPTLAAAAPLGWGTPFLSDNWHPIWRQSDQAVLRRWHFDFDVRGALNEGGDGGVIEVAFAISDEGGEHLLHLRGERQEDVVGFGSLERVA
jgi:N-methylhydantoinase B